MGGTASKTKTVGETVAKASARTRAAASVQQSVGRQATQDGVPVGGGRAARDHVAHAQSQAASQHEPYASADGNPGTGAQGSATSDAEGPNSDLLQRLQNLVVESTETDVQRPPHPLKVPLKGTRRRGLAEGSSAMPQGYATYKHIMVALHYHQQKKDGFQTGEDVAARLEISEADGRALVRYFAVFKEMIDESPGVIDERLLKAEPQLQSYLSSPPLAKPDP